jgi:DNA protecting protein DprA
MIRIISALILALAASLCSATEQPLQLADNAPVQHVVVPGDTLWGISAQFLKEPWRWPEIWRMNRAQVRNPNRIFPGEVIVLDRDASGNPLLRVQGSRLQPRIYSEQMNQAIPPIPPNVIEPFISSPLVIEVNGLETAARIVATAQDRVFLGNGDLAYVENADPANTQWQIYRKGKPLLDPAYPNQDPSDPKQVLGYEAFYLGTATQLKAGSPAVFEIQTVKQEIGRGDRLVAAARPVMVSYVPHKPDTLIDGRIISVYGGVGVAGRGSIVSVSRGASDGLEIGHVLALERNRTIVQRDETDRKINVEIPPERTGLIFVFRTFERISYALIVQADGPIEVNDFVRTPGSLSASESLASWLRLTLIPGIGGQTQRRLLAAFGLPDAIFAASYEDLKAVIGDKAASLLLETSNDNLVAEACAWSDGPDQAIVTLADSDYPQALLQLPDPPTLLYVRGRVELLNRPALAIVGSRNPTPQGVLNSEHFAAAFADAGLVIISGLALGIDAAAHRGALSAGGDTIALIGTGIDRIYPARNHELALEIGAKGAIVSELPIGTPVSAGNFPRRNRLISGMALGVLVVEATVESGSLITSRLAGEQGREVFAIPGSIHSPQSRGCHRLIKQGAKLVECAADVLDELTLPLPAPGRITKADDRDKAADQLLSMMGFDPCGLDELSARCGLSAESLAVLLLHLEIDGRVASLSGGLYQQLPSA